MLPLHGHFRINTPQRASTLQASSWPSEWRKLIFLGRLLICRQKWTRKVLQIDCHLSTGVSKSQSVRWKTADLLSSTDLLWQYWQLVLTAWCFYFGHISGNKNGRLAPSGSNWPADPGPSFSYYEQKSFGQQMFDLWAFSFFNLVFDPVKVGDMCHFLVQKLRMGVLYVWQEDESWRLTSFQCASQRVSGCGRT